MSRSVYEKTSGIPERSTTQPGRHHVILSDASKVDKPLQGQEKKNEQPWGAGTMAAREIPEGENLKGE